MMVGREGFADAPLLHDNHAHTVRYAPTFVGALTVEHPTFCQEVFAHRHDLYCKCCVGLPQPAIEFNSDGTQDKLRESVGDFYQHELSCDELHAAPLQLAPHSDGLRMQIILWVQQRQPPGGVHENEG